MGSVVPIAYRKQRKCFRCWVSWIGVDGDLCWCCAQPPPDTAPGTDPFIDLWDN